MEETAETHTGETKLDPLSGHVYDQPFRRSRRFQLYKEPRGKPEPLGEARLLSKSTVYLAIFHGVFLEVLRETRHKASSAGVPFNEQEQSGWQAQLQAFFKPAPASAAERRKRAQQSINVPRVASLD